MFANSFPLSAVIVCIKAFIGCNASMVFKASGAASFPVALLQFNVNVNVNVIVRRLLSIDSNLLSILDIDTTRGIRYRAALQVVVGGGRIFGY